MKAIQCELCGSNELVKQDGVFVCQYCGTKYTLEEARKMMIEGTVSVTGTVQIDDSGKVSNLIKLAREAFTDCRFDSVYSLCSDALATNPDNAEMIAMQGLAVLGKEDFAANIPSSSVNSMNRFFTYIDSRKGSFEERYELMNSMEDCLASVCKFKTDEYNSTIRELNSRKVEMEITVEQADAAVRWSMAMGSNTNVANSQLMEAKENQRNNDMLDREIKKVREKISKIDTFKKENLKKISAARKEQYWEANADEKAEIDKELSELASSIAAIDAEKQNAPGLKEIAAIDAQIKELNAQYDKLGLFKIKEKKALENQIEAIRAERRKHASTSDEFIQELSKKAYPLQARVRQLKDLLATDPRNRK